jgi:hypothetical protein
MSRARFVKVFGLTGILTLAMAAPALGYSQTAKSGSVAANFSWHGLNRPSGETLTIRRVGVLVYRAPVGSPFCGTFCSVFPGEAYVFAVRLESSQEPDVVLLLPTGGTGGGTAAQVFAWNGRTRSYRRYEYDFDASVRLESLTGGGRYQLVSGDGRFECVFTACAGSGVPIKIEAFRAGRFSNVTRSYPSAIRRDGAMWLSAFKQNLKAKFGNGSLAAWAADEEMLGQGRLVSSYLNQQLRAGHLSSPGPWPSGRRFITALMNLLRQDGYLPAHHHAPDPTPIPLIPPMGHCGG